MPALVPEPSGSVFSKCPPGMASICKPSCLLPIRTTSSWNRASSCPQLRVVWPEQSAVAMELDGKHVLILYEEHGGLSVPQKRPPKPAPQIYEVDLALK